MTGMHGWADMHSQTYLYNLNLDSRYGILFGQKCFRPKILGHFGQKDLLIEGFKINKNNNKTQVESVQLGKTLDLNLFLG